MKIRILILVLGLIISVTETNGQETRILVFGLADPQLGMRHNNKDYIPEAENLELAVKAANKRLPFCFIVCGDLVNDVKDTGQVNTYKRITGQLDKSITLVNVAGNHDVGNTPTKKSIKNFHKQFGNDKRVIRAGEWDILVINSNLFKDPSKVMKKARQQESWLLKKIKKASAGHRQIIIFQHHPWFLNTVDEPEEYGTLPGPCREKWLPLFAEYGVKFIFTGHMHCNQQVKYGSMEEVVMGSVGKSLCRDAEGFDEIVILGQSLEFSFEPVK